MSDTLKQSTPVPSKQRALAKWLPTCKYGDLSDAFGAGWDAQQPEIERLRAVIREAHAKIELEWGGDSSGCLCADCRAPSEGDSDAE